MNYDALIFSGMIGVFVVGFWLASLHNAKIDSEYYSKMAKDRTSKLPITFGEDRQ